MYDLYRYIFCQVTLKKKDVEKMNMNSKNFFRIIYIVSLQKKLFGQYKIG